MILDLDQEPTEPAVWAEQVPPVLGLIRAGVMYEDLELEPLRPVLAGLQVTRVFAAMGPALFWGRTDGPWVPYDVEVRDQNEDRRVRDRQPPWHLGDVVWVAGVWEGMPTAVRMSRLDGCDLYCAVGTGRVTVSAMGGAVRRRALATTPHAVEVAQTFSLGVGTGGSAPRLRG